MSPDPCHLTSSTSDCSNSPQIVAGKNLFRPVLVLIAVFNFAWTKASLLGIAPARASIRGRANSSNVTIVEMGLPGRPKKYLPSRPDPQHDTLPNTIHFPG